MNLLVSGHGRAGREFMGPRESAAESDTSALGLDGGNGEAAAGLLQTNLFASDALSAQQHFVAKLPAISIPSVGLFQGTESAFPAPHLALRPHGHHHHHHHGGMITPPGLGASGGPKTQDGALSQAQVDQLEAGFEQALASLDANLVGQVFAETLPIIGNNLADAAASGATSLHYVTALKTAIVGGLNTLNGSASYTEAQVESAINGALTSAGISGMGVNLDLSNGADIKLGFTTLKNHAALSTPLEGDLGLPNLGLHTTGNAQTTLNYELNFGAGLDGSGFYIDTAPGSSTFKVVADTKLPGFGASLDLAVLRFNATDQNSDLAGTFDVALKDPNGDGHLRLGELGGSPDLVDASLTGLADIGLKLQGTLPGGASLPNISTELNIAWRFNGAAVNPGDTNADFGDAPTVSFENTTLNLGSFFSSAERALNEITQITGPLQPVLDVLTAPLPILSDLGSTKVTLLDLGGLDSGTTSAIYGLADIARIAGLVSTLTHSGRSTLASARWQSLAISARVFRLISV